MSKFCQNCGSEIKEGFRFCEQCGSPADESYIQSTTPPSAPPMPLPLPAALPPQNIPSPPAPYYPPEIPDMAYSQPTQPKGSGGCKTGLLIGVGILILVAVLAVCFALYYFVLAPAGSANSSGSVDLKATGVALQTTKAAIDSGFKQLTSIPAKPAAKPAQPAATAQPQVPNPAQQASPDAPPQEAPTIPPLPGFTYKNISFCLPKSAAFTASGEVVAAYNTTEIGIPPGMVHPEYTLISFSGYPLADTLRKPEIMVFPNSEYALMDELAKEESKALQALLKTKPDSPTDNLPFLPLWNAGQMLHTKVKYLDFQNGSGVRYLTQYGQAEFPILSNTLFYTFQGLTSDGKFYIAAVLPVTNPILPADDKALIGNDFMAWSQNYPAYKQDIIQQLAAQTESSYTPGLTVLDAFMQSLEIK